MLVGIACQLWAATNVGDIPLSTLCETYSGSGETMELEDFNLLFDWYEPKSQCLTARVHLTFDWHEL